MLSRTTTDQLIDAIDVQIDDNPASCGTATTARTARKTAASARRVQRDDARRAGTEVERAASFVRRGVVTGLVSCWPTRRTCRELRSTRRKLGLRAPLRGRPIDRSDANGVSRPASR